ncbi:MAG: serine/threonine protein kinase [Planctomycetota bacterium]|nr:MAG: serine/threonine protein kinase [Planctomycetota bacterium]REJ96497.1 MAG: serine/threonine protein kinase [Planctomycetota bacterium]REK24750.1 MAG: serine/threonine protein kinase [Planctomycetota bacterium]REK37812.1 MAG: serine/threonine protein kinase [Planctomycetota bacterium]
MPYRTPDQLVSFLLERQLVDDDDKLLALRDQLDSGASTSELLDELERSNLLTGYQLERIRKGETDVLVLGGCRLLYRNASGSFARVFRASKVDTGEMIGVKVLRDRWAKDPDMVRLFHREGEIGQRLKHRHIVPVYGAHVDGPTHYITMEFVEGGNLRDFLRIRGRLQPLEALRYLLDMAQALEYALGLGVTHRDLKMTNVLMGSDGAARLIDFGLAADDHLLTRLGTSDLQQAVEYTTLERGCGSPPNDPRSDLFFLGVILYELLTGVSPYPRTRDREERKRFSRYRDVRPVTSVEPTLPTPAAEIVERLLRITPSERFQSPTELITQIRSALAVLGEPDAPDAGHNDATTVLCVEERRRQQDLLREYLTKHGYRVLLVSDVERALNRLKLQSPDCVLLMAESIGDRAVDDFRRALSLGRDRFQVVVMILGEEQSHLRDKVQNDNPLGRVLVQPVKLRDLRTAIADAIEVRARYTEPPA